MLYTIYKTINLLNGKHYIGKHQTKDLNDGYLGSGKILKYAISKYGIENFHKEILFICESEKQMNILEKILVVPDPEISYNICNGGKGGFGYINSNPDIIAKRDRVEGKIKGRIAANKNNAHIIGSQKHKFLLMNDDAYSKNIRDKLSASQLKTKRKDCPFCDMKNLGAGNYTKHIRSKH